MRSGENGHGQYLRHLLPHLLRHLLQRSKQMSQQMSQEVSQTAVAKPVANIACCHFDHSLLEGFGRNADQI